MYYMMRKESTWCAGGAMAGRKYTWCCVGCGLQFCLSHSGQVVSRVYGNRTWKYEVTLGVGTNALDAEPDCEKGHGAGDHMSEGSKCITLWGPGGSSQASSTVCSLERCGDRDPGSLFSQLCLFFFFPQTNC